MLNAYRGVGKTFFAIWLSVAVASGTTFLKWKVPTPRQVLYIDGEMPAAALQERFAQAIVGNEIEPVEDIKIISPDLQEKALNLSNYEHQYQLEPFLDGVDLIVVDNLSTLCKYGRENEAESWGPIQNWALQQRSKGRSILFIHHTGKNGKQRGTSKKEDILDTVIYLKRPNDYSPEHGAWFEIHFDKARGVYGDEVKPLDVKLTINKKGIMTWVYKELENSLTHKVADLLNDGVPQKEIAEILKVSKSTVSKHKRKAKEMGLLSDFPVSSL